MKFLEPPNRRRYAARFLLLCTLLLALGMAGCDFIDPTHPDNDERF